MGWIHGGRAGGGPGRGRGEGGEPAGLGGQARAGRGCQVAGSAQTWLSTLAGGGAARGRGGVGRASRDLSQNKFQIFLRWPSLAAEVNF